MLRGRNRPAADRQCEHAAAPNRVVLRDLELATIEFVRRVEPTSREAWSSDAVSKLPSGRVENVVHAVTHQGDRHRAEAAPLRRKS